MVPVASTYDREATRRSTAYSITHGASISSNLFCFIVSTVCSLVFFWTIHYLPTFLSSDPFFLLFSCCSLSLPSISTALRETYYGWLLQRLLCLPYPARASQPPVQGALTLFGKILRQAHSTVCVSSCRQSICITWDYKSD